MISAIVIIRLGSEQSEPRNLQIFKPPGGDARVARKPDEHGLYIALLNAAAGMVYSLRQWWKDQPNDVPGYSPRKMRVVPVMNWVLVNATIRVFADDGTSFLVGVRLKGSRYQMFVDGKLNASKAKDLAEVVDALTALTREYFSPWLTIEIQEDRS